LALLYVIVDVVLYFQLCDLFHLCDTLVTPLFDLGPLFSFMFSFIFANLAGCGTPEEAAKLLDLAHVETWPIIFLYEDLTTPITILLLLFRSISLDQFEKRGRIPTISAAIRLACNNARLWQEMRLGSQGLGVIAA
jgi:hypothetical protein